MVESIDRKSKIKELLEKGILIGGIITKNQEGFISFERINNIQELLEKEAGGYEIGFATKTMGRAIFIINENGEIENYKGVDSQLGENENALTSKTGTNTAKIPNPIYEGHHQIVLKSTPKEKGRREYEVRFMGTSPLEDLEIEADVNSKIRKFGVKVPKIISVKEFPKKLAFKLGLPTAVKGDYEELRKKSKYADEDRQRKENLKKIGIKYFDALQQGERPELLIEYFERLGLLEDERFEEFINNERKIIDNNSIGILDFIKHIDSSYSLGQRYGQATRIVGSPFRISDLEGFIVENNVEAIEDIIQFSQITIPECSDKGFSVEELFARQMGTNIALLINNGWILENFVHRQDYNLAGEMCDDSYVNMNEKLIALEKESDQGKREALVEEYKKLFLAQIHFMASNVKVLEQEMRLRGVEEDDISSLIDLYSKSFIESLDIEEVAKSMEWKVEEVKDLFINYFDTSKDAYIYDITNLPEDYIIDNKNRRDYVLELASKERGEKGIVYDDAILLASQENQDFYRNISEKCLEYFKQKNKTYEKEDGLPIDKAIKGLTLKDIGQGTTKDFSSNPEKVSKAFEALESGVEIQEEVKEGET